MNRRLAPVSEEPSNEEASGRRGQTQTWRWPRWLSTHLPNRFHKKSHLKILLSMLACPLFPLSPEIEESCISQVSSSAQYIIEHFNAATGCRKMEGVVRNMYAAGRVEMKMADDPGVHGAAAITNAEQSQKGCFVVWQMLPNRWLMELVVSGHKIAAGSDGNVAWRRTPWFGAHAAKGGVRPLRLAIQGLDPVAISLLFATAAQYWGEKHVSGVDCFVLKLSAEAAHLAERSDATAEMIKHIVFGYFSQKNGFLVGLEDSCLIRIQAPGSQTTYWETTMNTKIQDYRAVEGMMIAHLSQSTVTITRFGDRLKVGSSITRMEERCEIEDVAINVPGLSMDSFIPPKEMQRGDEKEGLHLHWRSPLLV